MASLRRQREGAPDPLPPSRLRDELFRCIEELLATGSHTAILFHPFLTDGPEQFAVMDEVICEVATTPGLWCAPCAEVAEWVVTHPEHFGTDPGLLNDTWR